MSASFRSVKTGNTTGLSNRVNLIEGIAYTGDTRGEKQNKMVRQT